MIDPSQATDAAALVSFGLTGRIPTDGSDYGRLYDRYRTDAEFRALTNGVAEGLGLDVIGVEQTGGRPPARPSSVGCLAAARSFTGLVPSLDASGQAGRHGGPTKRGDAVLRERCFSLPITLAGSTHPWRGAITG